MTAVRPYLGLRAFPVILVAALAALRVEPQSSSVTTRLRGISTVSSSIAWASGAGGTILRTVDGGRTWQPRPIPGTEKADFRDVDAFSDRVAYVLSIGSGEASQIYKTVDGGEHWDLQFANNDPKVFLDAMTFADETHGVAFSDSVDGAFVALTTSDGRGWTRIPADRLPAALPGEGAFAASGSNIAMVGRDAIWIGTTASRVLRSLDGGRTWDVIETPLATGNATGIFSVAFRDRDHGIVVGGNYQREQDAIDNAAITTDAGRTWTRVKGLGGFRSAVAWLPGAANTLIAVGPSGMDLSRDDGRTWTAGGPGSTDGFDAIGVAPKGAAAYASGARGRIARLDWEK
ncbi:MAG TPA: hypothetical protein VH497_19140 [Vicinamibacterales bacterium]|jgi:photosystem II stability/assembly factor-like uncharacterized protein